MNRKLAVIGAGGCAREVAWTIRDWIAAGALFQFAGYVVTDRSRMGPHDSFSSPVLGLEEVVRAGDLQSFVLGVGSPPLRRRLLGQVCEQLPAATWPSVIHPTVCVDRESLSIGNGVVICASAVVTVNVSIGDHVLIHYGCTVSHEVTIGENSVLNPSCSVSGGVRIGADVLIGVGSRVLQYRTIGDRAVVGAGAVVTSDVAAGDVVVGIPARPGSSSGSDES